NHESGTNDLDVYHKACVEYKMIYKQDFTLEHCYNVLKDHQGSASGGIDLNDEADEETEELRPMGHDPNAFNECWVRTILDIQSGEIKLCVVDMELKTMEVVNY
ncbi:hypothetical protein Tco_1222411, partial [Tanacetum coccineum]